MIDERLEEQASSYVLGALNEAELREFQMALAANAELRELVSQLSVAATAVSGAVPLVEPPPQLRAKVLAAVAERQKIVSLPERKTSFAFKWRGLLAACMVVVLFLEFKHNAKLDMTIGDQAKEIDRLNQLALSLQSTTNELRQAVLALQETNRLQSTRVAILDSLVADSPKTVAVSLWDNQRQDGVFVAENLKPLPADKDYELWVIDENNTPVAAGVFHVDPNGRIRMDFKPSRIVQTAGTFAVTVEAKGGVASPTIKNMVLAGN
jgi:anti-sigma-K factor RskA